jgi:hypothetical protein
MRKDGETVAKQAYNDGQDRALWALLGWEGGNRMTVGDFLARVQGQLEEIANNYIHLGEEKEYCKMGLIEGLRKLRPTRS